MHVVVVRAEVRVDVNVMVLLREVVGLALVVYREGVMLV